MNSTLKTTFNSVKKLADAFVKIMAKAMPALEADNSFVESGKSYVYEYILPSNFHDLPTEFAEQYVTKVRINPNKIYYLNDVYTNWQGVTFKNIKIFLPSLFTPESITYFQESLLLKQWFGDIIELNDVTGVAIANNQYAPNNYFHWIIDTLPRLLILSRQHPGIRLIIPESPAKFITETISAFGFHNPIQISSQQVVKAKLLILPDEHATPLGHSSPAVIREVRTRILHHLGSSFSGSRKRIFISREKQKFRNIVNQDEIDILLNTYNFEKVYFEELTMHKQVSIMQQASIVLSVHGANMVNCIFCDEGTPIIELDSRMHRNPAYWRLCSVFSLPYYILPCQTIPDEPVNFSTNADLHVDISDLTAILRKLID